MADLTEERVREIAEEVFRRRSLEMARALRKIDLGYWLQMAIITAPDGADCIPEDFDAAAAEREKEDG